MAVGTIGNAEGDMYKPIGIDLCVCTWCQWEGRQHVLPRSAHERSRVHINAARVRGVEVLGHHARMREKRTKERATTSVASVLSAAIQATQVELVKERKPRKLPKPQCNWNKRLSDRADEWFAEFNHKGDVCTLRVTRVGMRADNDFIAYHGLNCVGSENSLERAQALAEHPEKA